MYIQCYSAALEGHLLPRNHGEHWYSHCIVCLAMQMDEQACGSHPAVRGLRSSVRPGPYQVEDGQLWRPKSRLMPSMQLSTCTYSSGRHSMRTDANNAGADTARSCNLLSFVGVFFVVCAICRHGSHKPGQLQWVASIGSAYSLKTLLKTLGGPIHLKDARITIVSRINSP